MSKKTEKDNNETHDIETDENHVELSADEQEKILKELDAESNTRNLIGFAAGLVFVLLLAFSLFQLYTGAFGQFTAYIQRTVHLGFALTLIFLLYPARKGEKRNTIPWYDIILIVRSEEHTSELQSRG